MAGDAGDFSKGGADFTLLGARPLGPQDPATVGRYRMHALLGIGGMGRVYLGWAQQPGFGPSRDGAWVAVKVIRPDLADNTEFRRRFARELETIGRVRTPYAAALVQGDAEAEQPWMVTEFVPGVALADAVKLGSPLPAPSVWRLAHDLGNALVAVHQAGIVHRDIKPSNVILNTGGAKIIDFGVAHASDLSQLTATGMNVGTPSYMAPEQAKTGTVSPASDMFSLGVLLYFAVTGKLPFGEGGTAEVLFRVVYEEPDLSGLDHVALPADLRDVVLRCMAKDPLQRPNAAGVVAMAQAAAGTEAWSPDDAVQWPEPLAAQIHERTLAAGRTLPDPSLAEVFSTPHLPSADSEPTVFTGSGEAGDGGSGRKRHGVLVATVASVVVLGLGIGGYVVLGQKSNTSVNAASDQSAIGTASAGSSSQSQSAASAGSAGSASASVTVSGAASSSTVAGGGATTGAAGSAGQQTTAGTAVAAASTVASTSATSAASASSSPSQLSSSSPAGSPNPYTAAEACGSGYQSVASSGAASVARRCTCTTATRPARTAWLRWRRPSPARSRCGRRCRSRAARRGVTRGATRITRGR